MENGNFDFTYSERTEIALRREADKLILEGLSPNDAMLVAASGLASAGDNPNATVESPQTCRDLFGDKVPGLTTHDTAVKRNDEFAKTEAKRHQEADKGMDLTALWLKLSEIKDGRPVADKIFELVNSGKDRLPRFWLLVRACVNKGLNDDQIVGILKDIVSKKE